MHIEGDDGDETDDYDGNYKYGCFFSKVMYIFIKMSEAGHFNSCSVMRSMFSCQ